MANSYTSYRIVRADAISDGTSRLAHYGRKGQKWGVIRTPEQLGHRTKLDSSQPTDNPKKKSMGFAGKISERAKKIGTAVKNKASSVGKTAKEMAVSFKQGLKDGYEAAINDYIQQYGNQNASTFVANYAAMEANRIHNENVRLFNEEVERQNVQQFISQQQYFAQQQTMNNMFW